MVVYVGTDKYVIWWLFIFWKHEVHGFGQYHMIRWRVHLHGLMEFIVHIESDLIKLYIADKL